MNDLSIAVETANAETMEAEQYCQTCGNRLNMSTLSNDGPAGCPECGVLSRLLRAIGLGELPFMNSDAVLPDLKALHKHDALREIVESLVESGSLPEGEVDSIVATLLRREELGSTGIGEGVALPHSKHPAVTREVGTVAWSATGIDFDSVDQQPVHLIVLLLSPSDGSSDHIRALAKIARIIRPRS
ncbi:MAG: PTS transporter subunit EIIA [Planctomycetaceae bacterium]|jgi:mannitol/fructose-specific phosphotransferase system IIA component (Ntr-type)|nr:PTS transporter subunit EIIA [Planctomycetaceae bacterium]